MSFQVPVRIAMSITSALSPKTIVVVTARMIGILLSLINSTISIH
jgi:hypothetical protein